MSEEEIIDVTRQALILIIEISLPIMLIGLIVGVAIALFQALTQIQEMTLTFVPKIIATFLAIFILFPNMTALLTAFTQSLADRIIGMG